MHRLRLEHDEPAADWTVRQIVDNYVPPTWAKVFEEARQELDDISAIIAQQEAKGHEILPLKEDYFRAFDWTPLNTVKVIIVGQDPYFQHVIVDGQRVPRATGCSFGVRLGDSIPSSLLNIFKEIQANYPDFMIPDHGHLREWAMQGILLLNSSLTVRPFYNAQGRLDHDKSLMEVWKGFIQKVFQGIYRANPGAITVLWGAEAQKLKGMLPGTAIVLESGHPSGLSASKYFFGNGHFKKINEILTNQELPLIKWQLSSAEELYSRGWASLK